MTLLSFFLSPGEGICSHHTNRRVSAFFFQERKSREPTTTTYLPTPLERKSRVEVEYSRGPVFPSMLQPIIMNAHMVPSGEKEKERVENGGPPFDS